MRTELQETGNGSLNLWKCATFTVRSRLKQPARFAAHPMETMWAFGDKMSPRRVRKIIRNLLRIRISTDTVDIGMQQVMKDF